MCEFWKRSFVRLKLIEIWNEFPFQHFFSSFSNTGSAGCPLEGQPKKQCQMDEILAQIGPIRRMGRDIGHFRDMTEAPVCKMVLLFKWWWVLFVGYRLFFFHFPMEISFFFGRLQCWQMQSKWLFYGSRTVYQRGWMGILFGYIQGSLILHSTHIKVLTALVSKVLWSLPIRSL